MQMKILSIFLLLIAVSYSARDNDVVKGLETYTGYNQTWYSGFLNISTSDLQTIDVHYFFYPSQNKPLTDPVLLWLNGGPGCSSLLGATTENGPWLFQDNSTSTQINPYSWNNNASVIYLESPTTVGYSQGPAITYNDTLTAQINLAALQVFFFGSMNPTSVAPTNTFNDFANLNFFISGESYAGMYVPYLATAIDQYNSQQTVANLRIPLKGIAVGNACTHPTECGFTYQIDPWLADTLYNQGFYSEGLRQQYLHNCAANLSAQGNTNACINTFTQIVNLSVNNPYPANVYHLNDVCYHQTLNTSNNTGNGYRGQHTFKSLGDIEGLPPCADGIGPMTFFNNQGAKESLNVNINYNWTMCNNGLTYQSETPSFYLYPNLISKNYRIWVYSGDDDGAVPTLGTLNWINELRQQQGLATTINWRGWYSSGNPSQNGVNDSANRQNAGQYWQMDGLTFVTFKGAGHMVPHDSKVAALEMINTFLAGGVLPAF